MCKAGEMYDCPRKDDCPAMKEYAKLGGKNLGKDALEAIFTATGIKLVEREDGKLAGCLVAKN